MLRTLAPLKGALDCANSVIACPTSCEVPSGTMLDRCRTEKAYVDCYRVETELPASLSQFIEAFYSSPIFKVERRILSLAISKAASDQDAWSLGQGHSPRFSIWKVEDRSETEILLSTGRTRSWLMVGPPIRPNQEAVTLLFGSAVYPNPGPGARMGLPFNALLGFHKLYSRALLASALSRLPTVYAKSESETDHAH